MKLKKQIGVVLLFLVAVIGRSGNASLMGVGLEDMPDSLKKER